MSALSLIRFFCGRRRYRRSSKSLEDSLMSMEEYEMRNTAQQEQDITHPGLSPEPQRRRTVATIEERWLSEFQIHGDVSMLEELEEMDKRVQDHLRRQQSAVEWHDRIQSRRSSLPM